LSHVVLISNKHVWIEISFGRRGISWVIVTCDKLKNPQGHNDDNEDMICVL